jgi:hypothetical protein
MATVSGPLEEGRLGPAAVFLDPTVLAMDCVPDRSASLLFLQSGRGGAVREVENALELELDGVGQTTFFTAQPHRAGGIVDTETFIAAWAASPDLREDPPNAVLNLPSQNGGPGLFAVELSEPRLSEGGVAYRVRLLPDDAGTEPTLPASFGEAALFIDSFTSTVNDQITDTVTQTNVKVLGDAPAIALGNLFVATSQALSEAAQNASSAPGQASVTAQAATTQGVAVLYAADTASAGIGLLLPAP